PRPAGRHHPRHRLGADGHQQPVRAGARAALRAAAPRRGARRSRRCGGRRGERGAVSLHLVSEALSLGVFFSVALLLAALGEMFNQRAGVFNLGCEGIMCMGAFLAFLPPYYLRGGPLAPWANVAGVLLAALAGVLLGLLFALVTVTFRAPQGIAGIGLQMLGWGTAGTLFRSFIGGVTGVEGIAAWPVPGLSRIPYLGSILF